MKRILTTAFALVLLTAGAAQAQQWYIGAFGTASDLDDFDFGTALGTVKTTFDETTGFGVVVGREIGAVRIEGEWSMRYFDVEDHILAGAPLPGPTGDAESRSHMLNLYYDFNRDGRFQPYLGGGVGLVDVELDGFGVAPIPDVLTDDDSGFAYQVMAGVGIALSDSWDLFVDLRMQMADGLEITASPSAGSVSSEFDWEVQDIALGLRYSF